MLQSGLHFQVILVTLVIKPPIKLKKQYFSASNLLYKNIYNIDNQQNF